MRTIQVSADLYAAIWKRQEPGESTEEEILRRILEVLAPKHPPSPTAGAIGFYDRRFGVKFRAGFEIFRLYLGQEYRANAADNHWLRLDNGEVYPSLNQLSESLGASENAWDAWYYMDDGKPKPIAELRDPSKVRRRPRRAQRTHATAEELGL